MRKDPVEEFVDLVGGSRRLYWALRVGQVLGMIVTSILWVLVVVGVRCLLLH